MSNFISVIITTFNRSLYLEETLISIQNQTYSNIEIIVVDDGSIEELATENKLICKNFDKCTYYFKENTGQPDSRNYGINLSKGDYIAFCDDDDFWALDKLEKQLKILIKYPEIGLVSGCAYEVDEFSNLIGERQCPIIINKKNNFEHLLIKNRFKSPTPLIRREVFDKVGLFDSNYTIAEDWEFWRRVSYYYKFYALDETLAYVRNHSNNMSKTRNNTPLARFLLYRKLTGSLIKWGKNKFNKEEYNLIYRIEWQHYRNLLINHYIGNLKKITFIKSIALNNFKDAIHFIYLYLKFEIF